MAQQVFSANKMPVAKSFNVSDFTQVPNGALTEAINAACRYARSVEGMITAAMYAQYIADKISISPERAQALAENRAHVANAAALRAEADKSTPSPCQIACEIVLPAGTHQCSSLKLCSNIRLRLESGASLVLTEGGIDLEGCHDVEIIGTGDECTIIWNNPQVQRFNLTNAKRIAIGGVNQHGGVNN